MKILLIDNGTKSLTNLFQALGGHLLDVKHFTDFEIERFPEEGETDLVILSGSGQNEVLLNEASFAKELTFIQTSPLPILGICLGSELIAHAFGATLKELPETVRGPRKIDVLIPEDPLFKNKPPLQVFESHHWAIETLGEELLGLAKSDTGYEIIKHKTLPRYGFQFHPEAATHTAGGVPLLENALEVLGKR